MFIRFTEVTSQRLWIMFHVVNRNVNYCARDSENA